MTIFDLPADQQLLLTAVLAKCLSEYYNATNLNILGNFFIALGSDLTLVAAAKEAEDDKIKNQTFDEVDH